jgi:DNA/RNA endonuclease G (NUC1)
MTEIPTKGAFATCAYSHTAPSRQDLTADTRILNVVVGYDEALKLQMGLQSALLQMSRYNFSTKRGKRAAILLAVHLDQNRLSLHEGATRDE